jgi:hypothetical protein
VVPQGLALPKAPRERHITRQSGASRKGEIHKQVVCGMNQTAAKGGFLAAKNLC